MAKNADIVLLSENEKYRKRVQGLADRFDTRVVFYNSEKEYIDTVDTHDRFDFIIMTMEKIQKEDVAVMSIQALKFIAGNATIVVVVDKKATPETATFLKKSGVTMVLFEDAFLFQSKLEFVFSQNAVGNLVPVKSSELVVGKDLPVNIYHVLPLNNKILPIVRKGEVVDQARINRMNEIGEFYIKRDEIDAYAKWLEKNLDGSANGLKARCRAQFLNLTVTYKSLVTTLVDQGGTMSFAFGKDLLDQCRELSVSVISSLSGVGDAWDVINLAGFVDINPVDRCPAIAAYSGFVSLLCDIGDPKEVMIGAMLADLALLEFPPEIGLEVLKFGPSKLVKESDLELYYQHPLKSLNITLERRLPLSNSTKEIILCTHELPNGKGFPSQKTTRVPQESQLIRFCELLDFENRVAFGKERTNPREKRKMMIQKYLISEGGEFSPDLMMRLKSLE